MLIFHSYFYVYHVGYNQVSYRTGARLPWAAIFAETGRGSDHSADQGAIKTGVSFTDRELKNQIFWRQQRYSKPLLVDDYRGL